MSRLLLYLAILIIGAFFGSKGLTKEKVLSKLELFQNVCLLFLLFIMGIRIGIDKNVLGSFFKLGYQAVVLSFFSILFSVLAVKSIKKFIEKDNKKENMSIKKGA
ncbi:LysO family transporter [Anaeromicrobium sediminis]|uniref:DUF340 domain-containing protein n=1 Tax=Anaeromicrobium sediminis TaxID=1478221 RepID=A0A267MLL0_9FIRM|nr:LysO family transporter [Anaeromicrobium sediminis]PAB60494.1 hypothetical protein CCE28_06245 [Anaeromicrobium sediminis]